ncbi:MAG: PTS sugar transporter subunit IIC, partial [Calditrichia bacterium]|nr:PTS sugar transporter subunit IIC [Calditrichia bacterium]
ALASVIIALDTTHIFQTMISQPIFACSLIGLIFGEPVIGITAGLIFEVSFLKSIPVGAAVFPENSLGSLAAVIYWLAINQNDYLSWEIFIPMGILLGLIISFIGMHFTTFHRSRNVKYLDIIVRKANNEILKSSLITKQIFKSLLHYIVLMYVFIVSISLLFYFISIKFSMLFIMFFGNSTITLWVGAFLLVGFARMMNQYINFRKENK